MAQDTAQADPTTQTALPYVPVPVSYWAIPVFIPFHKAPQRFRVLCCGRRIGKSTCGINELMRIARTVVNEGETDPRFMVVAPTFGKVEEDWRIASAYLHRWIAERNEAEKTMKLHKYGQWDFRSADSHGGAARGAGYNAVLLDEAAYIPEDVWESDIRPSLADRRGRAIFLSTPFGRNWFHTLWKMSEEHPEYSRWHYTTWQGWESRFADNPPMLEKMREEWEQIQRTTSDRRFREEYLAEFLEGEGQFFNLTRCLRGSLHSADPQCRYVAGLDVAHVDDWMAVVVVEVESNQVVGAYRCRYRSWSIQKAQTKEFLSRYPGARVFIDSTGVGDPIFQDLSQDLNVESIVFTQKLKGKLVENLAVAFENGYLGIPDESGTHWLMEELRDYQETRSSGGVLQYGAPEGKHDDGVTALMLACWGIRFSLHARKRHILSQDSSDLELTSGAWDEHDTFAQHFRSGGEPYSWMSRLHAMQRGWRH